jgi:hypothetical protein
MKAMFKPKAFVIGVVAGLMLLFVLYDLGFFK